MEGRGKWRKGGGGRGKEGEGKEGGGPRIHDSFTMLTGTSGLVGKAQTGAVNMFSITCLVHKQRR